MTNKLFRTAELGIAVLLGGLTGFYRTSLARSGTPLTFGGVGYSTGFLYGLIVLCILGFAVCAVFFKDRQLLQKGTGGRMYTGLLVLSALALFAAFAVMLGYGADTLFQKVQLVFLAVCGVAMIVKIALGERHKMTGILSLFPVYYLGLFLLKFYRENANNPVVQSFGLEIITILAMLAAVYAVSSLKFEWPRVRQQIFCTLAAVYLLVVEGVSALLYKPLVFTVPGMTWGILFVLIGFGIYITAAFFQAPVQVVFEKTAETDTSSVPEVEVSVNEQIPESISLNELIDSIREDEETPEGGE